MGKELHKQLDMCMPERYGEGRHALLLCLFVFPLSLKLGERRRCGDEWDSRTCWRCRSSGLGCSSATSSCSSLSRVGMSTFGFAPGTYALSLLLKGTHRLSAKHITEQQYSSAPKGLEPLQLDHRSVL